MANKKTVKRRRGKKKPTIIPFEQRNFPNEIVKQLEQIVAISGHGSASIFEDLVLLSEVTLAALPEQIKAVGATGRFAEDTPEAAEVFAQVRSRYSESWLGQERSQRVWQHFAKAFALLLEATEPGLWGTPNSLDIAGISGPDILGYLYQTWVNGHRATTGEVYTPWPVARLMAELTLGQSGERLVYDRLKEALCHPDNILGAAVLLAGLTLPENEPETVNDYFINRVVPAAIDFYTPVSVCDPALGSSILNLAAASIMPEWMVKLGLIRFVGQDISRIAVAMSRAEACLYGLNGYALQLEAAVVEALAVRQQTENEQVMNVQSPIQAIRDVYRNGAGPRPENRTEHSFEVMFRAAARADAAAEWQP